MKRIKTKKISCWEAISIGIGGMVGGGIFSVLGLSIQLTHGAAPIAFLLGGIISLFTAYSYAHLCVARPSSGGTVYFIDQAYGSGFFTGAINILLWLSYIVMLSVYAYAFGSYCVSFFSEALRPIYIHIAISSVVILLTLLNFLSVKIIGSVENLIVALKLAILCLFIIFGMSGVDTARLSMDEWASPLNILIGGMIIFLAYEGFELIANTAEDIQEPSKNLPRAFYTSVLITIALYMLIAIVTAGSLSLEAIIKTKDYALAEAARPTFGNLGFTLIAIAAMLSTSSAINATIYGTTRISYIISVDGELPEFLEKKIWDRPIAGLLITSILTLIMANFFDLEDLALMGSAGFLFIFAAVNGANMIINKQKTNHRIISFVGMCLCLTAVGSLVWYTIITEPASLFFLFGMVLLSALIEAIYQFGCKRKIKLG